MANANVTSGALRVKHAMRTLIDRWEVTRDTWNDGVRRDFEERHIRPLESAADAAMAGLQELAEILDKIRRDCSDREAYY